MTLQERVQQLYSMRQDRFEVGRERAKTEDILDMPINIVDYGHRQGRSGPYVVCLMDDGRFFFAGSILVSYMEELESMMDMDEIRREMEKEPLRLIFHRRRSNTTGNYYTDVEVL